MNSLSPTYKRLLRLLSYGIYTSADCNATLGARLTDRQWYKIIEEAEKQTVSGVVFDAVSRLRDREMPPLSILAPWLAMTHRESKTNETMSEVLAAILAAFRSRGLNPVLQKGHAIARFYPDPRLRSFGDIDLWFPDKQRAEADKIISQSGVKITSTPDSGSRYLLSGINVEHHSMLVEIHNPMHSRLLKRLYAENKPAEITLSDGTIANVPSPLVELLMINAHILKHCLGVGIGLRQFCDYSLAWRALTDPECGEAAIDEEKYFDICRRLGIGRWTLALHEFIDRFLPATDGKMIAPGHSVAQADAVERIFSLVAQGGNFGHYNPRWHSRRKRSAIARKTLTMASFVNNRSFVYRLAPAEAFWTFSRLLAGQIH